MIPLVIVLCALPIAFGLAGAILYWSNPRWHCRAFHGTDDVMFIGGSEYECRKCGQRWPVPWTPDPEKPLDPTIERV